MKWEEDVQNMKEYGLIAAYPGPIIAFVLIVFYVFNEYRNKPDPLLWVTLIFNLAFLVAIRIIAISPKRTFYITLFILPVFIANLCGVKFLPLSILSLSFLLFILGLSSFNIIAITFGGAIGGIYYYQLAKPYLMDMVSYALGCMAATTLAYLIAIQISHWEGRKKFCLALFSSALLVCFAFIVSKDSIVGILFLSLFLQSVVLFILLCFPGIFESVAGASLGAAIIFPGGFIFGAVAGIILGIAACIVIRIVWAVSKKKFSYIISARIVGAIGAFCGAILGSGLAGGMLG